MSLKRIDFEWSEFVLFTALSYDGNVFFLSLFVCVWCVFARSMFFPLCCVPYDIWLTMASTHFLLRIAEMKRKLAEKQAEIDELVSRMGEMVAEIVSLKAEQTAARKEPTSTSNEEVAEELARLRQQGVALTTTRVLELDHGGQSCSSFHGPAQDRLPKSSGSVLQGGLRSVVSSALLRWVYPWPSSKATL